MGETNLGAAPGTDPWARLAVGSPWDGFALEEEITLPVAAQAFDGQQPGHLAALAFLQAEVEARGWSEVLAADGITDVRDLFGAGARQLLSWLDAQLSLPARQRFTRYWYGWEAPPALPERPAPDAHWLTVALQTWDPTHPPHQAALAYLEGVLRERGLWERLEPVPQELWEVWLDAEQRNALLALTGQLPRSVVQTFQVLWVKANVFPSLPQRAREYNGHPQQLRAIAWLEGRIAASEQPIADLIPLFERGRQRDTEAIACLQQLERQLSPELRQRFREQWEA